MLNIYDLSLTGTLPSSIGLLTNLITLNFFNNSISGTLPDSICQLTLIQQFSSFNNRLEGTLPSCLGRLTNATLIAMDHNTFSGSIPSSLGDIQKLQFLTLSANQLTGSIPGSFANLSQIGGVDISYNKLTGVLPSYFELWPNLVLLLINDNHLSGTIPSALGSLLSLENLCLGSNRLSGSVPSALLRLSKLKMLRLNRNKLTGNIPNLSRLSRIVWVNLNDNYFSGSLSSLYLHPDANISFLDVSNNQLTGTIPSTFFAHESLQVIALASNCLDTIIPQEMCLAEGLQVAALDGLHASPFCRAALFDLAQATSSYISYVSKQSRIPTCIFSLRDLRILHLSGNGLSGSLSPHLNVSKSLRDLSLSFNDIHGAVPVTIQNHAWDNLDLSYNKFSGVLSSGMVAGNASVSLVVNRLSGKSPTTFSKAKHITVLEGNLFECNFRTSALPQYDTRKSSYKCGSDQLQVSVYLWLSTVGMLAVVGLVSFCCGHAGFFKFISYFWEKFTLEVELTKFEKLMTRVRVVATVTTALIIVFLLPTYGFLGVFFATHEYRYGWSVSTAYLSGLLPAVVLLVVWSTILSAFAFVMSRVVLSALVATPEDQPRDEEASKESTSQWKKFVAVAVLGLANFIVVLSLNAAYVATIRSFDIVRSVMLQMVLGAVKAFWSCVFVDKIGVLLRCWFPSHSNSQVFDTLVGATFLIGSNVFVPGLAEAFADPNCFYNVLFVPNTVSVDYTVGSLCVVTVYSYCHYTMVDVATSYTPPFNYSYQCSSQLIVDYTSVFVYMFLALSFWGPLRMLAVQRWTNFWTKVHPPAGITPAKKIPTFQMSTFWAGLLTYLVCLLTYGVMFPPLALLICIMIWIETYTMQFRVYEDLVTAEGSVPELGDSSLLVLLITATLFYTPFLFDIAGDELGMSVAIWPAIIMLFMPILIISARRLLRPCKCTSRIRVFTSIGMTHKADSIYLEVHDELSNNYYL